MNRQASGLIVGVAVAAAIAFAAHRVYVHRCVRNEIAKVKHGSRQECADAVHALGRLGRPAVQPLRELLHNPDLRGSALEALGYIGPSAAPAVPEMLVVLQSKTPSGGAFYEGSWHLLGSLGRIGPGAQAAVPFLGELLGHTDACVRVYAARALWYISRDPRAIPTMVDVLRTTSEVSGGRLEAFMTLETIGPDAKAAVPTLVECIREPSFSIYAVRALGAIGPAASEAVPALNDLARNATNAVVRKITIEALRKIEDK